MWSQVEALIIDVDGVMTHGDIIVMDERQEIKFFNVQDGFGLRLLLRKEIPVAVISSRQCAATAHRVEALGIKWIFQGQKDKLPAFEHLAKVFDLDQSQIAYVGDDWPDLPILNRVGMPIAVANARPEVKAKAKYITQAEGGCGALREVAEHILRAKGFFDELLVSYQ